MANTSTPAERAAGLTLPPGVQAELKRALPQVAADAVEAIIAEVPTYDEARDYMVGNIETAVRVALGSFLTIAARADDPSTPLGPARQASYALGRGEARSGRSMDALLSAYRIGARVSWRELSAVGVKAGMSATLLAQFAELVFAYIDELSAASVAGHADELASTERTQQRQLERLALDIVRGAPEAVVGRRADSAGWKLPRLVTVLLLREADLHAIRGAVDPKSLVLTEDLPNVDSSEDLTVLVVPDLQPAARRRLLRTLGDRDAVLGPARPWPRAASSYRRALQARRLLDAETGWEPTAYDTDEHLAELILGADREALEELRSRALAPLADLTPAARDKLVETLRLWVLHRGRREAVAEALFVHPQTVRYRVGQLRELFGDTLDDPAAMMDLMIALGVPATAPPRA